MIMESSGWRWGVRLLFIIAHDLHNCNDDYCKYQRSQKPKNTTFVHSCNTTVNFVGSDSEVKEHYRNSKTYIRRLRRALPLDCWSIITKLLSKIAKSSSWTGLLLGLSHKPIFIYRLLSVSFMQFAWVQLGKLTVRIYGQLTAKIVLSWPKVTSRTSITEEGPVI